MRLLRAIRKRSCAPAPWLPTRPRISYEKRLSSSRLTLLRSIVYNYGSYLSAEGGCHGDRDHFKGQRATLGTALGRRPAHWALSEDRQVPTYEAALQLVSIEPGDRVLDIGCGVGAFLHLAAGRGGK